MYFQFSSLKEPISVPSSRMHLTSNHITYIFYLNLAIRKPGASVKEVMEWNRAKTAPLVKGGDASSE